MIGIIETYENSQVIEPDNDGNLPIRNPEYPDNRRFISEGLAGVIEVALNDPNTSAFARSLLCIGLTIDANDAVLDVEFINGLLGKVAQEANRARSHRDCREISAKFPPP